MAGATWLDTRHTVEQGKELLGNWMLGRMCTDRFYVLHLLLPSTPLPPLSPHPPAATHAATTRTSSTSPSASAPRPPTSTSCGTWSSWTQSPPRLTASDSQPRPPPPLLLLPPPLPPAPRPPPPRPRLRERGAGPERRIHAPLSFHPKLFGWRMLNFTYGSLN